MQASDGSTLLTGWGRTQPSAAHTKDVKDAVDIGTALSDPAPRGVIARGLGRSYGDAAQNAGGDVLVTTDASRIIEIDRERATATLEAGVSLNSLMRASVPLGLWPAVTPGTRQVTIGGALAADVHGKNHHRDGTFGMFAKSLTLHTPARGEMQVGPDQNPDVFWATLGGMGLTGVVSEATISLRRIETSMMKVDTRRAQDLDDAMASLAEMDVKHRYCVAWIDCLARGKRLGRSVVDGGDHALAADLPSPLPPEKRLSFRPFEGIPAPPWAPTWLLNQLTIGAFNELWYRKSPASAEGHLVPAGSFFHPLDMVSNWNRIYGRSGFVQYQFVVPDSAGDVVREALEGLSSARAPSFLAVLKRFGPGNQAPLSFPQAGWTLALDVPTRTPGLARLFDRLDERVASVGGRIYLAKDSRLRPELLEVMYPALERWRETRERLDPDRVLRSDLSRRLPALLG